MKDYCEKCEKYVDTEIKSRKETFNVCGDNITLDASVMVCAECGEELFNEQLDETTLLNAYNLYRKKHKLLLPDEIKAIRKQYRLS